MVWFYRLKLIRQLTCEKSIISEIKSISNYMLFFVKLNYFLFLSL